MVHHLLAYDWADSSSDDNWFAQLVIGKMHNPLDVDLCKDDYRFPNKPISSTELDTYRFLQGARGYFDNGWDWELLLFGRRHIQKLILFKIELLWIN